MIRNFKDGFVVGFFSCVCLLVVLAVGALLHAQSDTSSARVNDFETGVREI